MQSIELNALPLYNDKYVKTKIRGYGDKAYANFLGLNILEDGVKGESFTIISYNYFFAYQNKYYLQVYLDKSP